MKKDNKLGGAAVAVIALTVLAVLNSNAQNYSNTFSNSAAPGQFDYDLGALNPAVAFASGPAFDAGGSATSGSAKLSWSWDDSVFSFAAFTFTINATPQDFSGDFLSFDLMLASATSTAGDNGDYGVFQVVARNTDNLDSQALGSGGGLRSAVTALDTWTHIVIPMGANGSALRAITFQDLNTVPGSDINGPETIYIDNLKLGASVPEPSTIAFAGMGIAGLLAARRFRKN